jgi:hypothetical protein
MHHINREEARRLAVSMASTSKAPITRILLVSLSKAA